MFLAGTPERSSQPRSSALSAVAACAIIFTMLRVMCQLGAAGVFLLAAFAGPTHARAVRQTPTPTATPTPAAADGALGDATVASPGSEQVTSPGGPIGSPVIPAGEHVPSCPHMNTEVSDATAAEVDRAALCLINKIRRGKHLRALKDNPQLRLAAERHARDMVANTYFSHVSKSGRDVSYRVTQAGYVRGYPSWRIGENIAWASGVKSTARRIVLAWLASPPHKQNLLNRTYREAGLAVAPGAPAAGVEGQAGTYANVFGTRSR